MTDSNKGERLTGLQFWETFSKKRFRASFTAMLACFIITSAMPLNQPEVAAQALLYDNTDHLWSFPHSGPKNITWTGAETGGWFEAQPFKLGGHDNIASVSIPMGRDVTAAAQGTLRVSIWDDSGQGFPGREVGGVGEVDIETLEIVADFSVPQNQVEGTQSLPSVTFDTRIDDLVPGETYYVFIDYRDLARFQFGDVLVGLSNDAAGSNRAGPNLYTEDNAVPPFEDRDWFPASRIFGSHQFLQMSVSSDDEPYAPVVIPVGTIHHQDFTLGDEGQVTFMPPGWAFSDSARRKSFDGRDLTEEELTMAVDERFFDTSITEAFPAGRSLGRGTPVFNAGVPGDADRALALGVTRTTEDGMLQLVAEVAGGDANSVQLAFDIEAWDAASGRDLPGEAAFNVSLDLDTGDGFAQLLDLGTVTTGATLLPPALGDFINGNAAGNRVSFDSGLLDVDLPEGSLLRVRWMADKEAETRGWVFGLDNVSLGMFGGRAITSLQAGDADQDLDFDQLDLVQVQIAAKYLTEQPATWGEGDWNSAPGGSQGSPPTGDGWFDQLDIVAAQQTALYLAGPYAAIWRGGQQGDSQTSVVYDPSSGEVSVDLPSGAELTSINIDSVTGIFTGDPAQNLGGSFDNDADANIFKATFGSSFGSVSFGNVAQTGLSEEFLLGDLSVVGSLAGGGDLGSVDLVYVPEPASALLLTVGLVIGLTRIRRAKH